MTIALHIYWWLKRSMLVGDIALYCTGKLLYASMYASTGIHSYIHTFMYARARTHMHISDK